MKYLKLFESQSIKDICREYNIKNYHINGDGTVDVHDDVYLDYKGLDKIPLNFDYVSGFFSTYMCVKLTTLIGCPKRVGGNFSCSGNKNLTSLEGCPTYIGGIFLCRDNYNLWSLAHFPRHAKGVFIGGSPICQFLNYYMMFTCKMVENILVQVVQ